MDCSVQSHVQPLGLSPVVPGRELAGGAGGGGVVQRSRHLWVPSAGRPMRQPPRSPNCGTFRSNSADDALSAAPPRSPSVSASELALDTVVEGSAATNDGEGGQPPADGAADGADAQSTAGKKRRSSLGARMVAIVGLSYRSRSTSQLSQTGGKKLRSTVQRSTETGMAAEMRNLQMGRQASRESTDDSMKSYMSEGNLVFPGLRFGPDSQFSDFLDGLGPAQMVGRQTLATPSVGDIQVGMVDRTGHLEVEIVRARGLSAKRGSKSPPAPYVKLYLLESGTCLAKKKTKVARRSLDPVYQQHFIFEENPHGKVLQIIVWGDYGRMDNKCFMGAAQVLLEDLDLSSAVIGWYKLFPTFSLVDPTLAQVARRPSQSSLESAAEAPYMRSF
ncbi:regulating synaptic membrane exocytosis protein 3-like isoform X1 [Petromyzon marinus]|uniref:Regulating synaptic membrane exocytosis protein 3-like isoform X1 n=1 Tax=Petromyzon marinus TaxID=7757 RepID=A0AAJ7TYH4_PETMA|nr:regulating synaptic membrane exocytosis protein 3-like isoform X1 [Petromyzon marinus]